VADRVPQGDKKGKKGPTVKIRDVLDHKGEDAVWAVINGEVYTLVGGHAVCSLHGVISAFLHRMAVGGSKDSVR
jgi:hypothetical protein